jgi:hypothetical protein
MKKNLLIAGLMAAATFPLGAQDAGIRPEVRPFMGMSIPTGTQRDLFQTAAMLGVQAALEMGPQFHLLGTFGWVPGQAKFPGAGPDVQILQYDVGAELNLYRPLNETWLFKPFLGAGGGARTYLYDDDDLRDRTCTAGYAAAGMELQVARTALRFEARENIFCFRSPVTGIKSRTRNEVGLALGVAYHFR